VLAANWRITMDKAATAWGLSPRACTRGAVEHLAMGAHSGSRASLPATTYLPFFLPTYKPAVFSALINLWHFYARGNTQVCARAPQASYTSRISTIYYLSRSLLHGTTYLHLSCSLHFFYAPAA